MSGAQGRWAAQGARADSRLRGFGFEAQCLGRKVWGAGHGALGGARGPASGRGWARGALGTATRAAAPGDGLRADRARGAQGQLPFYQAKAARGPFFARRPFYRRFIKPRQPVDQYIASQGSHLRGMALKEPKALEGG